MISALHGICFAMDHNETLTSLDLRKNDIHDSMLRILGDKLLNSNSSKLNRVQLDKWIVSDDGCNIECRAFPPRGSGLRLLFLGLLRTSLALTSFSYRNRKNGSSSVVS